MIGVDTNILVRIFVADDGPQAGIVRRFLSERSAGDPAFVSSVVLAETVWVLESTYNLGRDDVIDAIQSLLDAPEIVLEHEAAVQAAFAAFRRARCDFADALLGEIHRSAGCGTTVTFDRRAARLLGFERLA